MSEASKELVKQIADVRAEFIEETYPVYFGQEEMGDVTREFTPSELTAVLHVYEFFLAEKGLLQVIKEPQEEK